MAGCVLVELVQIGKLVEGEREGRDSNVDFILVNGVPPPPPHFFLNVLSGKVPQYNQLYL